MELFLLFAMMLSLIALLQIVIGVNDTNSPTQVIVIQQVPINDDSDFYAFWFYLTIGLAGLICCLYNTMPELFM